jgi:hypothetical protein
MRPAFIVMCRRTLGYIHGTDLDCGLSLEDGAIVRHSYDDLRLAERPVAYYTLRDFRQPRPVKEIELT